MKAKHVLEAGRHPHIVHRDDLQRSAALEPVAFNDTLEALIAARFMVAAGEFLTLTPWGYEYLAAQQGPIR